MEADQDRDGKISFEEFKKMVENTDVSMSMTLGERHSLLYQFSLLMHASQINFKDKSNFGPRLSHSTNSKGIPTLMVSSQTTSST